MPLYFSIRSDTVRAIVKWPAHSRSARVSMSISRRRSATSRGVWAKSLNLVPASSYAARCWCTSQSTLRGCFAKYVGNFVGMTRSTSPPAAFVTSTRRHASAPANSSSFGWSVNGIDTICASWPRAVSAAASSRTRISAPPCTNGTCASRIRMRSGVTSGCVAEIDDIAVLDDVLLAFEADLAVFAAGLHRAARHQRIVGHHFPADEAPLDVPVDFAGPKLAGGGAGNRPGAALVLADGEEGDVAKQVVAGSNDAIEARLGQAEVREEGLRIVGAELRDFELDLRAERDGARGRVREERRQARLFRGARDVGAHLRC